MFRITAVAAIALLVSLANSDSRDQVTFSFIQKGQANSDASLLEIVSQLKKPKIRVIHAGPKTTHLIQVDPSHIEIAAKHLPQFLQQATAIPYTSGTGKNEEKGFQLVEIVKGGLFDLYGFKPEDIILSANKESLDSPSKAMELYQQIKSGYNFTIEIKRKGKPITFKFETSKGEMPKKLKAADPKVLKYEPLDPKKSCYDCDEKKEEQLLKDATDSQ